MDYFSWRRLTQFTFVAFFLLLLRKYYLFDKETNLHIRIKPLAPYIVDQVQYKKVIVHDDNRDISEITWQKVEEPDNPLSYVLSTVAFFDQRIKKIVVFLQTEVGERPYDTRMENYTSFICGLYFMDDFLAYDEVEGYFYNEYMFYCPLTVDEMGVPNRISIAQNYTLPEKRWTIPVVNLQDRERNFAKTKRNLVMCVGILFGYQNWLMLLQYIEYHRLQGFDKLIFFYSDLHWSSVLILQWYKTRYENFVELVHWAPFQFRTKYLGQSMRNNFCVYSLMYKYKYVASSDIDELFVTLDDRLDRFLEKIDERKLGSFMFQVVYQQISTPDWVELNATATENISQVVGNFIPLCHFNNISTFVGFKQSPKTIMKPETVQLFGVHQVLEYVKNSKTYMVPKEQSFLRHFKIRSWWGKWAAKIEPNVNFTLVPNPCESDIGNISFTHLISNIIEVATNLNGNGSVFRYT